MGGDTPVAKNHKKANGNYGTNYAGGMGISTGHRWQHSTQNLTRTISGQPSNTGSDETKKTTTIQNNTTASGDSGDTANANNMYSKNSAYFTEFSWSKGFFYILASLYVIGCGIASVVELFIPKTLCTPDPNLTHHFSNPSYNGSQCPHVRHAILLGMTRLECSFGRRLVMSILMGGLIGWERRQADRPAGIRTMSLVSLGSCLFTINSTFAFLDGPMSWDASRISAAIPSGVGFLGAGLIFKKTEEDSTMVVHGLTTAASVWLSAAVGIACGGELYFAGSFGTALMMLLLRFGPRGSDVEEDDEDEDFDYEMNDGEDEDEEENIDSSRSIRSMKSRSTMGHIEIGTDKRSQATPPPPRSPPPRGTTQRVPTKDPDTTRPTAASSHHRRDTPTNIVIASDQTACNSIDEDLEMDPESYTVTGENIDGEDSVRSRAQEKTALLQTFHHAQYLDSLSNQQFYHQQMIESQSQSERASASQASNTSFAYARKNNKSSNSLRTRKKKSSTPTMGSIV